MIRHLAGCLVLLVHLCPRNAHAQDDPGPSPVQVKIHGDPAVFMRVVGREESPPIAQCTGDCSFWTLPGRYTVYSHNHTTGARHELNLRVKGFGQYQLIEGNDTVHGLGVGLEVVGVAASAVGTLTVLYVLAAPVCETCADNNGRTIGIGLGILASGIACGVFGFGLETSTRAELVPANEWAAANRRGPSVRFGLVPVSTGLGLGALALF